MKIMVADGDPELVAMLSYLLKGHGFDVVRAFDGEQAIKYWRETLPDLVILDVQLSKLNGFEVCRQMRQETNSIVLILTALGCGDDEVYGLEIGADDFLRKPFSPRRLLARINAIARRSYDQCRVGYFRCHGSRGDTGWHKSQTNINGESSASLTHDASRTGAANQHNR